MNRDHAIRESCQYFPCKGNITDRVRSLCYRSFYIKLAIIIRVAIVSIERQVKIANRFKHLTMRALGNNGLVRQLLGFLVLTIKDQLSDLWQRSKSLGVIVPVRTTRPYRMLI